LECSQGGDLKILCCCHSWPTAENF